MVTQKRLAIAAIIVALLGVGLLMYFKVPPFVLSAWNQEPEQKVEIDSAYTKTEGEAELAIPEGSKLYRNEKYNFKFIIPEDLSVQETEENGTFTAVFMNPDNTLGFQIFITPYAGWFVTEDRIKMDIPSGKVENQVEVLVDGTKGTIFFSEHAGIGETREVWFLHGDYLYEVTTPKLLDEWLSHIMTTWRFLKAPQVDVEWR